MTVESEPVLLSVRETARRLGVHPNTIRNWVKDGTLPSARVPGARYNQFDERDVERLRRQRGKSVELVEPERRTIGPELVNATELALWADAESRVAQGLFPELMRRLLEATSGVTNISIRTGDGIALPGWDGQADVEGASFLPDGRLRFEFGVGRATKKKADADFEHRASTRGAEKLTFVFATPRRWRKAASWAEERRTAGPFRDVRVVDADDLEGWLRATPAVHHWISERLGRRPRDAETLGQWWERFSQQTNPALPLDLFGVGRDRARDELIGFLRGAADAIVVQAPWRDDALAFVASVISDLEKQHGEQISPLVVKSADVWERLITTNSRLVLLPLDDAVDIEPAVRRGHHVVVPVGPDQTVRGKTVRLDPPHRNLARESLERAGLPFERAYELSALARRNMPSFVRELGRDKRLREPAWSLRASSPVTAPLVLVGSWMTATDDGRRSYDDVDIVSEMVGEPWPVIERELLGWLREADKPFVRTGEAQWHMSSPHEVFLVLCGQLTSDDVRKWRTLAPEILLERDPTLELVPDERWLAGVRGVGRRFSTVLRRGIADGLALVGSLETQSLGHGASGADEARRVVAALLQAAAQDRTGATWQGLSDVLPLIAEAAPDAFLDAVHDDLSSQEPLLRSMFQDAADQSWLSSSSPHTGLLWALETVAWSERYLERAAVALAQLEFIDPGGKLGNRPLGSLQAILPGWIRHTSAPLETKLAAIEQVLDRFPTVGWRLLVTLLPTQHSTVMPPHAPRHRDWLPNSRSLPVAEWLQYIARLVELAVSSASDVIRWAELAHHAAALPPSDRASVLEALDRFAADEDLSSRDHLALWEALRTEAARHRKFKDAEWVMDEASVLKLEAIADRIEPQKDAERFAYLFEWRPDLPDIPRDDFNAYGGRLNELRVEAVRKTFAEEGIEGLRKLALRVPAIQHLGGIVGEEAPDSLTPSIASWLDSDQHNLRVLAQGWASQRLTARGPEWLAHVLGTRELQEQARRLNFVLSMPAKREFWDALADQDPTLADQYWRRIRLWNVSPADLAEAADQLLAHDSPWVAIDLIAGALHQPEADRLTLPSSYVDRALDAALKSLTLDPVSQTLGYEIGLLLDFLESAGGDVAKLAQYEFGFFGLIEDHRVPRALYAALADDPGTFVSLVSSVYRGKDEPARDLSETEVNFARQAHWVLMHWNGVPGLDASGVIDGDHLADWVSRARLAFAESDRADIGDEQIGQVLSNSPPDAADSIWPAEPIRRILETTANKNIESGLFVGHFNNRGGTSRGVWDGGRQEYALAAQRLEWSRQLASKWPRTSRILRLIGESYERHGRHEDARAEIDSDIG